MEQIIAESDSNESKTAQAAKTEVPLFDPAGSVTTAPPTETATMPKPEAAAEKRGRGRPKGSTKKAPARKPVSPEVQEAQGVASAELVVASLDLVRKAVSAGECPETPELRAATVQAWAMYFEENGWEVPAWVQVSVISVSYIAPAFTTETGKGRIAGMWAKVKGWWVARHG